MLSVPIIKRGGHKKAIKDVLIDNSKNWSKKHWAGIRQNYSRAPYFKDYADFFEEVYSRTWDYLADLNIHLIQEISGFLGIQNTRFTRLSSLNLEGLDSNPTQRLIQICEAVGADNYIIGTRAQDYMEEERWQKTEVTLEYFEPQYPPYPQIGEEFLDNCAIIDLLFNCGPHSGGHIWGPGTSSSKSNNE